MKLTSHKNQQEINAALVRAIELLQNGRYFTDAYYLTKMQFEQNPSFPRKISNFINCAYESGLLNECAEFLIELTEQNSHDYDLLNYTAGLLGTLGQKEKSRIFAKMAASCRPFSRQELKAQNYAFLPCSVLQREITDTLLGQNVFSCRE